MMMMSGEDLMAHRKVHKAAFFFIVVLGYLCCLCGIVCAGENQSVVIVQRPTIGDFLSQGSLFADNTDPAEPKYRFGELDDKRVAGLKSPSKAMLLSVLLPGAGQVYTGSRTKSRVFLSAEAATWLAFGGFQLWNNHKKKEFQGWAAARAGVDPEGKPDDYWRMMTYYDSRKDYEIYGRAGEPDRASYPDLAGWDWQWDSENSRTRFRELRNQAKEARRRATFTLGAMVINRIVAALDAYRSAKSHNSKKGMERIQTRFKIKGKPFGKNQNVMLVFEGVF